MKKDTVVKWEEHAGTCTEKLPKLLYLLQQFADAPEGLREEHLPFGWRIAERTQPGRLSSPTGWSTDRWIAPMRMESAMPCIVTPLHRADRSRFYHLYRCPCGQYVAKAGEGDNLRLAIEEYESLPHAERAMPPRRNVTLMTKQLIAECRQRLRSVGRCHRCGEKADAGVVQCSHCGARFKK